MKSYRIFLPLFLLFFVTSHITVDAKEIPKTPTKKSSERRTKTSKVKKAKTSKKKRSMSMYTKEIHPGDKMLINNFGKQVGFEPKDFSKVDEKEVCAKKACKADTDQSTCYRAFRGDIERPEKGCQGYQRRTMGKNIGKSKKNSRMSSGGVVAKPGGKPTIGSSGDGPLAPDVLENSTTGVTPVGDNPAAAHAGDSAAAIAGIGGAAVIGGIAMNTLTDDNDGTTTPENNGIHSMFAPAAVGGGAGAATPGAIPPAAACATQIDAEALGVEIKTTHNDELAALGTDSVAGSENPQASHQALYNLVIDQLVYLATITDLTQLNSGIGLLIGHLRILAGTNSIQSHFSSNLANKIISAVSCVKNIGNPVEINQSIGWMAEQMAD